MWPRGTCDETGWRFKRACDTLPKQSLLRSSRPRRCSCLRLSVSQACGRAYIYQMADNANTNIFHHAAGQPLHIFVEPTELTFRPKLIRDLRVAFGLTLSLCNPVLTARLPAESWCQDRSLSYRCPSHHCRPRERCGPNIHQGLELGAGEGRPTPRLGHEVYC